MIARKTFWNIGWRYLTRHPWQSVLMIVGITLGVAVVVAVDLANASASRAFDLSTETVAGRATHEIVGGPPPPEMSRASVEPKALVARKGWTKAFTRHCAGQDW